MDTERYRSDQMISTGELEIMSLKEALAAWQQREDGYLKRHPTPADFRKAGMGLIPPKEVNDFFGHLSRCTKCRRHFWEVEENIQQQVLLDAALPKAATSERPDSFSFLTEGGKCRVIFSELLEKEGQGVVSLKIEAPYRSEMEGKRVVVTDSNGKELIRGKIINGESPANLVNAKDINWEIITIVEEAS